MKTILYIATSQDNYIADKNGGVDWLTQPDDTPDTSDELGYQKLLNKISIIIMGNTSYQQIIGFGPWAWTNKITYVFTHNTQAAPIHPSIHFVSGDVVAFMARLTNEQPEKDVWLLGGADIAHQFAAAQLIDECIITIVPKAPGDGIRLNIPYDQFRLADSKNWSGMIQKRYMKK